MGEGGKLWEAPARGSFSCPRKILNQSFRDTAGQASDGSEGRVTGTWSKGIPASLWQKV